MRRGYAEPTHPESLNPEPVGRRLRLEGLEDWTMTTEELPEYHAELAGAYYTDFVAEHERLPTDEEERALCGRAYRDAMMAMNAGES